MPLQRFLLILPQKVGTHSSENKDGDNSTNDSQDMSRDATLKNESANQIDADVFGKNNNSLTGKEQVNFGEEQFKIISDDEDFYDIDNYEPYILICKQTAHANHIKRLIVATGQKLLTTLNL